MYDALQRYVLRAEHVAAVIGRGGEFLLLNLDGCIGDDVRTLANEKGFTLCGVIGITGGVVGAECDPHPDSLRIMVNAGIALAGAIAGQRARALAGVRDEGSKGDSLSWLNSLHALSDTREGH